MKTPRPPVQSKSKKRAAAELVERVRRGNEQAIADAAARVERDKADAERRRAQRLERKRKEEALKAMQLTEPQRGALGFAFPWVTDWSPKDETFFELETEAGSVTFEHLAALANAFKTRDINVVGQTEGAWYPEDAEATVRIELRGPMLLERIRIHADVTRAAIDAGDIP